MQTEQSREELFAEYDGAVLTVQRPDAEWVDAPVAAVERNELGIVVTAWNPGFARPSRAENDAANARLYADIEATGLDAWPATGCSPDFAHCEPGWIVWGMSVEAGLDLARKYDQFAVYVVTPHGQRTTVSAD